MFEDKILAITGGTGSFGNQVISTFINTEIKKLIVFSRDELKQNELRQLYNNDKLEFIVGDVRDLRSLESAFRDVDYIFHAAALKQVPSCEFFPIEAVKTNILGTDNVIRAAITQNVKKVVCLSTDKATYPVNAMGMSKGLMEKVALSYASLSKNGGPVVSITRYGNVLCSRGSVVPLFMNKIKNKLNLPITDPAMTRFIMTLEEAMDLVLFAFQNSSGGELYVQKSPACRIDDLATALIDLSQDASISSFEIGSRHGEKSYEVLLTKEERSRAKEYDKYFEVIPDSRSLNYEQYLVNGDMSISLSDEYNSFNTSQLTIEEIKSVLVKVKEVKEWLADL